MAISSAIDIDRVSRVLGYQLTTGNFQNITPNLPQRIAILGEANTANQSTLDLTPKEITSAKQAGDLYGYGSPIYNMVRILRPVNSNGVGGIPVIVYPQAEDVAGVKSVRTITIVGNATANAVHTVIINGRRGVDGGRYDFSVVSGDTPTIIATKIIDAINNILGSPVDGTSALGVATLTAKWKGLTSNDIHVEIDTNGISVGSTYAVASPTAGSGTSDITTALGLFGANWNTIVINSYGVSKLNDLVAENGAPSSTNPTGRYQGNIMKPFIALFGNTDTDVAAIGTITDARKDDVTNAICVAPGSKGLPMEAATNYAFLFATVANNTPHLDVNALFLPDMPVPISLNIGDMANYNDRDVLVKKGSSTVDFVNGKYQIQDFVTCYHPDGEVPPQFRYCRNLMIDFNVKFGYRLLEEINVVDHAIANDDDIVDVDKVVKPKQWKQIIDAYADELGRRALIADIPFMQDSIQVGLSTSNPDRLETFFKYKRSGIARIGSTTVEAGFNFG